MKTLITLLALTSLCFATAVMAGSGHSHGEGHSHSHDSGSKKQETTEKKTETQPVTDSEPTEWKDTMTITIPAEGDKEYKVQLTEGQTFEYAWKTGKGELFFDFHGEPKGDTTGYFKTFEKDTKASVGGVLTAEFTGTHGWYWKNNKTSSVEVTLNLKGDYSRLDEPVDQATAEEKARAAIASLVEKEKLDKSWESIKATSAETIEFNGDSEWMVIFDNEKITDIKKQRLYVFLKITGEYIAANYTGK